MLGVSYYFYPAMNITLTTPQSPKKPAISTTRSLILATTAALWLGSAAAQANAPAPHLWPVNCAFTSSIAPL